MSADGASDHGSDRASHERRAQWATIKALPWARIGGLAGVLGVIVGVVFGIVGACGSDEPPSSGPTPVGFWERRLW